MQHNTWCVRFPQKAQHYATKKKYKEQNHSTIFLWQVQMESSWVTCSVCRKTGKATNISYYIRNLVWSYQTILNHSISRGLTSSSSLSQFAWSLQCNKTHTTCTWSPCKTALSKRCTVDKSNPSIQNRPQRTRSKSNFTHNHQQFLLPPYNWAIWQIYRMDHAEKRLEFRPGKWTSEKWHLRLHQSKVFQKYITYVFQHTELVQLPRVPIWHFRFLFLWLQYRFLISMHSLLTIKSLRAKNKHLSAIKEDLNCKIDSIYGILLVM